MSIAVIGAGLSGLAFCFHYKKLYPSKKVVLFDKVNIGTATSSLAHMTSPYAGRKLNLNPNGHEAFEKTVSLLQEASSHADKTLFRLTNILRLCALEKDKKLLLKAVESSKDITWQSETPYPFEGVLISKALQIDPPSYLQALFLACQKLGVLFEQKEVNEPDKLPFDHIVLATGYLTPQFFPFEHSFLKGQLLQVAWDKKPLPHCITLPGLHIIPAIDHKSLYIGSTFERSFDHTNPTPEGKELILDKASKVMPDIRELPLISHTAGVRLYTPPKLPFIDTKRNISCITAMGSKGLLYHAYLAEKLAHTLT